MKLTPILILTLFAVSCTREESGKQPAAQIAYDIFPVIGQSNTYNGAGFNPELDKTDTRIKQLGRFGDNNYKIIDAKDPLEHHTIVRNCNGFAMTFAFNYLQNYWEANRQILLIPGAKNNSSFRNYEWRKGDTLYNDLVRRVKYVLEKYPGSKVKGFLWHQGEADIYWGRYYTQLLDKMITDMRRDIAGAKGDSIPFILGGFVPYWVEKYPIAKITDSVIRETPSRIMYTGFASPQEPFVITKPDNSIDDIHFDANGQRIMGLRYFKAYQQIKN